MFVFMTHMACHVKDFNYQNVTKKTCTFNQDKLENKVI